VLLNQEVTRTRTSAETMDLPPLLQGMTNMPGASRNHGTAVALRCETVTAIFSPGRWEISDWKRCAASLDKEHELWNECSRLLINAILYYNMILLSEAVARREQRGDVMGAEKLLGVTGGLDARQLLWALYL
jgi:Tn3 transposase DDE domain